MIRCGRENQHPAEGALRSPIEQLQLERRCWNEDHVPERLGPRPPVEQPRRTGKKRCYGHKSGGQYVAVLFGLQLPLTGKTLSNPFEPFQIKWEVYFSKELCRSSLLCHRYDSTCICICVCIVGQGYTTFTWYEHGVNPKEEYKQNYLFWKEKIKLTHCIIPKW